MFCEHCQDFVSKSTYYRHKEEFSEPNNPGFQRRRTDLSGIAPDATVRSYGGSSCDVGNSEEDCVDLQSSDVDLRDVTMKGLACMHHAVPISHTPYN